MGKLIVIKADTNDGDYVQESNSISDEDLKKFEPLIEAIKKTKGHNWATADYAREPNPEKMYSQFDCELVDEFNDFVPRGENGVHTITAITIYTVTDRKKLI